MLVKNILAETAARMVTIILGLVAVPITISHLGLAGFGAWESVLAVASLGAVVFAPIASCVLWLVATTPADVRLMAARSTGVQAVALCGVVSALLAVSVFVFGDRLVVWLKLPAASSGSVFMGTHVLALACLAHGLLGASDCIGYALGGLGRLRHATFVRTGALALNYFVSIILLGRGFGLLAPLIGLFFMGIVGIAVNAFMLFRGEVAGWSRGRSIFSVETMKYASTLFVGCFAGIGKDSADRIISSGLASPAFTATLGLASRLTVLLGEFNRYAYTPLIPAVATARSLGDVNKVSNLFARFMAVNAFASGLLTTVLVANSEFLLNLWTGVVPEGAHRLTVTVAAGVVMQLMLTGPATAVMRGLGRVREEATYVLLSLVINVCLTLVLVPLLDAYGKVLSTSIAVALSSLVYVVLVTRSGALPPTPFFHSMALYLIAFTIGYIGYEARMGWSREIAGTSLWLVSFLSITIPAIIYATLSLLMSSSLRKYLVSTVLEVLIVVKGVIHSR